MKLSLEYLYLSHAPLGKVLRLFLEACPDFCLLSKRREQQIIDDIALGDAPVSRDLFEAYSNNLRKAINTVFADSDTPLADSLRANVSRFSAYKAAIATEQIRSTARNGGDPEPVLHKFNRYQATEYSTAVNRARTGKQFAEFCQDRHLRLFPNLRWLPSTSADPREEHRVFWNRVWPKDDPFWNENQPGNLWNCHCDWEETDDDATADNPKSRVVEAHQGLEGNPAETGNVFSDEHTYISKAKLGKTQINMVGRDALRSEAKTTKKTIKSNIGNIDIDRQSYEEIAQANIWEKAYWHKIEIAKNFDQYTDKMVFQKDEDIDLSHNKYGSKAYKRKKGFAKMKKYLLPLDKHSFIIKMGEYPNGDLALYTIYQK